MCCVDIFQMNKHKFGKWNAEDLKRAVSAIDRGDTSLSEASRTYGVPKGTLSRHLTGKKQKCCWCC